MSQSIIRLKQLLLLAGDIAILYSGLALTLALRYRDQFDGALWDRHLVPFTIVFGLWIIIAFANELYDLKTSYNTSALVGAITRLALLSTITSIVAFYVLTPWTDGLRPQRILLISVLLTHLGLFGWRKIFYQFIKSPGISTRVLVIGHTPLATDLAQEINKRPQLGYSTYQLPVMPPDITEYCQAHQIDSVVLATTALQDEVTTRALFKSLSLGIEVHTLESFYEDITNKVPVEAIEERWFLDNLSENSKKTYELPKRLLDIVVAGLGIVVTAPFLPLIALIIKLESRGPVIFRQIRTGRHGRPFRAMKFRSMLADAEKNGPQWSRQNDPRVTRFGRFMRKTRLDEIPQLINVLRGELSIVGPRPERPEFIELLTQHIPFYRERLLVKPGLSGWAQLKGPAYGGSVEESLEKVKYDLYYIKHRSLMLDINIILKTIKVVLSGRGQ